MARLSAAQALPGARETRRLFDRASASFAASCIVHDEARRRLLERLGWMRVEPNTILDLGCALGAGAAALAARYPGARVVAVDNSLGMLAAGPGEAGVSRVASDATQLALQTASVDLLMANMLLPWCAPEGFFGEAGRVLRAGGVLLFATLGPDTLDEVRRAWARVDDRIHVHASYDMHDLGDIATAQGLLEPVVDVDRIQLTYADLGSLVADLRGCGATNVAAGRRRGLTGPRRWAAFEHALEAARREGRLALTVELILGHAWGHGRGRPQPGDGSEVAVPVDRIGRAGRA